MRVQFKTSMKRQIIVSVGIAITILLVMITAIVGKQMKAQISAAMLSDNKDMLYEMSSNVDVILDTTGDDQIVQALQAYCEEKAGQDNLEYAVIVDTNVQAIAHSDSVKLNKVYDDEFTVSAVNQGENGKIVYEKYWADQQNCWVYNMLSPIYKEGKQFGVLKVGVPIKAVDEIVQSFYMTQIICTVIGLVIICLLVWLLVAVFMKHIPSLINVISKTAELDLSDTEELNKLAKQNSEIGEIAKATFKMQQALQSIVNAIKNNTNVIDEFAYKVSDTVKSSVTSTKNVSSTIGEVATANQSLAGYVQESVDVSKNLADSIEKLNLETSNAVTKLDETKSLNKNGADVAMELMQYSDKNLKTSEEIQQVVGEVVSSSNEIGGVVDMIMQIASQTNLLALNASIEAARAGEFGKGFAVVAEEIRKLAEQTDQYTAEINNKVNAIQSSTQIAVKNIDENYKASKESNKAAAAISEVLNELSHSISYLNEGMEGISNEILKVVDVKNDLLSVSENLSAISEETSASSEEISSITVSQTAEMENLYDEMKKLKDAIDTVVGEVSRIKIN